MQKWVRESDSAAVGSFGRDFFWREMDVERFSFHHLHVLHFWIIVDVVAPASPQNARKITIYEIFFCNWDRCVRIFGINWLFCTHICEHTQKRSCCWCDDKGISSKIIIISYMHEFLCRHHPLGRLSFFRQTKVR